MAFAIQGERQTTNIRNNSIAVCWEVMRTEGLKQRKREQVKGAGRAHV